MCTYVHFSSEKWKRFISSELDIAVRSKSIKREIEKKYVQWREWGDLDKIVKEKNAQTPRNAQNEMLQCDTRIYCDSRDKEEI